MKVNSSLAKPALTVIMEDRDDEDVVEEELMKDAMDWLEE